MSLLDIAAKFTSITTNIFNEPHLCGGDGALISFEKQSGCAIGACQCLGLLHYCNKDIGDCVYFLDGTKKCTGQCDLSVFGWVLTLASIIIIIFAPVAFLLFNRYRSSLSVTKQRSSAQTMNAPEEMKTLSNGAEDNQDGSGSAVSDQYLDMTMFDDAPAGFVKACEATVIRIETVKKASITSFVYFLIVVFVTCIVVTFYPFEMKEYQRVINDSTCSSLYHNDQFIHQCEYQSVVKNEYEMEIAANITASLPAVSSFISFSSLLDSVNATQISTDSNDSGEKTPFISFNYSLSLDAGKGFSIPAFNASVLNICECDDETPDCSKSSCPAAQLAYILQKENDLIFRNSETFVLSLKVLVKFPKGNAQVFPNLGFSIWSNEYQSSINHTLDFLSAIDVLLLMFWVFSIYVSKQMQWSNMLNARKWLCGLLLFNFIQNNPFVRASSSWFYIRDVWTTISTTIFLLFLLFLLDVQRKNEDEISTQFYVAKLTLATGLATARIIAYNLVPSNYLGVIDLYLAVVAFIVFVVVGAHVARSLSRVHYIKTRHRQLASRVLYVLCYMVTVILLCSVILVPVKSNVSNYMAKHQRASWLALEFIFHAITIVIVAMYLPVENEENNSTAASYTIRAGRQYKYLSPMACHGNHPDQQPKRASQLWQKLRTSITSKLEDFWKPHSVFCVETACLMFNFTRAAYQPDPENYETTLHSKQQWKVIANLVDEQTDTFGFVAHNGRFIVVSFRGTVSKANIKTDLDIAFTALRLPKRDSLPDPEIPDDAEIHSGFHAAYHSVRPQILEAVEKCIQEVMKPESSQCIPLYCNGHSLGGALATVCALDLSVDPRLEVVMYNFGSPRVGNGPFANWYNIKVPKSFRIVNDGDLITGGPKRAKLAVCFQPTNRYKHIGLYVLLDGRGYGDIILGPSIVERALMARFKRKPTNHMLQEYKLQLEKVLELSFSFTEVAEDKMTIQKKDTPVSKFFATRFSSQRWTDTLDRVKNTV